jgi:hypothetical protein
MVGVGQSQRRGLRISRTPGLGSLAPGQKRKGQASGDQPGPNDRVQGVDPEGARS